MVRFEPDFSINLTFFSFIFYTFKATFQNGCRKYFLNMYLSSSSSSLSFPWPSLRVGSLLPPNVSYRYQCRSEWHSSPAYILPSFCLFVFCLTLMDDDGKIFDSYDMANLNSIYGILIQNITFDCIVTLLLSACILRNLVKELTSHPKFNRIRLINHWLTGKSKAFYQQVFKEGNVKFYQIDMAFSRAYVCLQKN